MGLFCLRNLFVLASLGAHDMQQLPCSYCIMVDAVVIVWPVEVCDPKVANGGMGCAVG